MIATTLLTFLTSDNLFLPDICSYFLFLKRVLSCLKSFLFPVKSKKPNMIIGAVGVGGGRELVINSWG